MVRKIVIAYVAAVIGAFVLAAVVKQTLGLELAMKVQWAAQCLLILPFQLAAWVISWFSGTPGAIDQVAINNAVFWTLFIAAVFFGGRILIKKMKAAWAGVFSGGHARHP